MSAYTVNSDMSLKASKDGMRQTARGLVDFLDNLSFVKQIKRIVTDNGPSFTSELFMSWCEKAGVKLVHSAPYHPQGNGIFERKIQTIKAFVVCYTHHPGVGSSACPLQPNITTAPTTRASGAHPSSLPSARLSCCQQIANSASPPCQ